MSNQSVAFSIETIKRESIAVPLCKACLDCAHCGGEPEFDFRDCEPGEACGAADHEDHQ